MGNSPVAFGDWNSSNALAVGILAALWNAQRTGVGDKVVTSLYHVSNWGMMSAICAQQQGQQHPKIAPKRLVQPITAMSLPMVCGSLCALETTTNSIVKFLKQLA